ncbi:hypothetical protein GCM10027030_32370 [Luteococcus sediminum]
MPAGPCDQAAQVLSQEDWQARAGAHRERAEALLAGVVERRRRGERHPVEDFLFDYYTLRPGELVRWHPGAGVVLDDPDGQFALKFYRHQDGRSQVDVEAFLERRGRTLEWTVELLSRTAERPAALGCFGMHEWAMVYHLRPDQTRHSHLPLRFDPARVAEVVEQVGVRCSHFDAFRFFTEDAVPLNSLSPTRETQAEMDQPGCLHANMDLYKWCGKMLPLVDSGLLLDCYGLALEIRELDMQASAYDLSGWGYEPVAVETPEGRAEYVRRQRGFSEQAQVLRRRLLGQLQPFRAVLV